MALNNNTDATKSKLGALVPPGANLAETKAAKDSKEEKAATTKAVAKEESKIINTKKSTDKSKKNKPGKTKMGRPPKEGNEPVYNAKVDVYLTATDKEKLARLAKEEDRTLGYFTRKIIEDYLSNTKD